MELKRTTILLRECMKEVKKEVRKVLKSQQILNQEVLELIGMLIGLQILHWMLGLNFLIYTLKISKQQEKSK